MSAASPGSSRAGASLSDRTLWIVAADCGILALAAAQALRPEERIVVVLALAAISLCAVATLAARALRASARSGDLMRLLLGGALAAAALIALAVARATIGWRPVLLAVTAFVGLALVVRWLVAVVEQRDTHEAPWRELAAGAAAPPRVARRVGVLAAVGVTLLIAAGIGAARYALTVSDGGPPLRTAVVGAVIAAVLMALVAGPVALVAQVRSRRAWAERERGRQRQAVAAHLHDSVLQTLALIQRSAGDEQRVRQLARQQERGLRDWLSGRDIDAGDSVAQSLAAIAAAVEDECPGDVSIEVISVSDARVGPAAEALLQAAREAVRNAAHHAGGVVRVVFDPDPSTGELVVFIRDAGPGFDPQQLPAERRGVRDAIIGRMEHVGGSASIETGPDGTEVVLRVPFSAEAGR